MPAYLRPNTLTEALSAIAARPLTLLAGGTDFYPSRVGVPLADDVLDLTAIPDLRRVDVQRDEIRIGATTTWSDLLAAPLPDWMSALTLAAREVGGAQIQNAGTLAGNLCNASPAADGVPPLLALDARVELASVRGIRASSVAQFIVGSRRTRREADEIVTAIVVPTPQAHYTVSDFLKLGSRRYLVISFVMVAACLAADARGCINSARIAVGACSPVAMRLPDLERALVGQTLGAGLGGLVDPVHLRPLQPISDVRADAAYRIDAAATLVARVLERLGGPR